MRARGCLIALAVALALSAAVAAVVGPPVLRRARQAYAPIARLKSDQADFEAWVKGRGWREPERPSLTAEKLDAFLALRRDLRGLEERQERMASRPPEGERASLRDVPDLMRGVRSLVADRLAAFRRHGLTPAEYDYLERLVYGQWLDAIKSAGGDPVMLERAAAEIDRAARGEPAAVQARLRQVAAEIRARVPPAPPGVPDELHRLLLSRAAAIEAQPAGRVPPRVPRGRPRRRPASPLPVATPP